MRGLVGQLVLRLTLLEHTLVTGPELSMAAIDDRSYLYPHAWSPPLTPLPTSRTDAALQPEVPLIPLNPDPAVLVPAEASEFSAARLADSDGYSIERAVIGDALRIPVVWCEFGSCIARFTDPAALGESDVRTRAATAGWRQDALGRWACPNCVQHDEMFMVVYPLVKYQRIHQDPGPGVANVLIADALTRANGANHGSTATDNPQLALGPSAWDSAEPPRLQLAVTDQREPGGRARRGRRDAGRHRWQ